MTVITVINERFIAINELSLKRFNNDGKALTAICLFKNKPEAVAFAAQLNNKLIEG